MLRVDRATEVDEQVDELVIVGDTEGAQVGRSVRGVGGVGDGDGDGLPVVEAPVNDDGLPGEGGRGDRETAGGGDQVRESDSFLFPDDGALS